MTKDIKDSIYDLISSAVVSKPSDVTVENVVHCDILDVIVDTVTEYVEHMKAQVVVLKVGDVYRHRPLDRSYVLTKVDPENDAVEFVNLLGTHPEKSTLGYEKFVNEILDETFVSVDLSV